MAVPTRRTSDATSVSWFAATVTRAACRSDCADIDSQLHGGEDWWAGILERIRSCDVFLSVVSQSSLDSEACRIEREYARQIDRTIIPVALERDIGLGIGETEELAGYTFEFRGTRNVEGPNYSAVEGEIVVTRDGEHVLTMNPQKRTYRVQRNPMTEASIDGKLSRDLFVALGDPLGENRWSVRMQYKPLIRLIWLGALLMALGGAVSASDRRYRAKERSTAAEPGTDKVAAT